MYEFTFKLLPGRPSLIFFSSTTFFLGAIFFNFAQGVKDVEKGLWRACGNEEVATGLRENTTAVEAFNMSDDLVGLSDVTRGRDDMHLFSDVVRNISSAKSEKNRIFCCGCWQKRRTFE